MFKVDCKSKFWSALYGKHFERLTSRIINSKHKTGAHAPVFLCLKKHIYLNVYLCREDIFAPAPFPVFMRLSEVLLVETKGFEPSTSRMRTERSPN